MVHNPFYGILWYPIEYLKRAVFHNESLYPDAHTFKPERFLKGGQIDPNVKDPEKLIFGWGRR